MNELQKIASIFQSNLGNRITMELANGMIQEIARVLPQITEPDSAKVDKVNDNQA